MKTNLKTFPTMAKNLSELVQKQVDWKEAFEKELQERLATLERMQETIHDGMSKERLLLITNIKEILGEG